MIIIFGDTCVVFAMKEKKGERRGERVRNETKRIKNLS